MKLDKHIAYNFILFDYLKDHAFREHSMKGSKLFTELYKQMIYDYADKYYYITKSIVNKFKHIKHNKKIDWSYFKLLKEDNYSLFFILPNDRFIRIEINEEIIMIFHYTILNRNDGVYSSGFIEIDIQNNKTNIEHDEYIEELEILLYKLMSFYFFAENGEKIIQSGQTHGHILKGGKITNPFPFPIKIIDNNWNITSIRTEEFGVRGHFAMRWTGEGRTKPKLVFIKPFKKSGYVRKAKNLTHFKS